MNQDKDAKIAIQNELIAGLERENKIQAQMIQQLKNMNATLEYQFDELTKLLEQLLKG